MMDDACEARDVPDLRKCRTLRPRVDNIHEFVLEALEVLFFVHCKLALLRNLSNDSRLLLDLAVWLGQLLLKGWHFAALLLEDEATQTGCALLRRELVEESVEQELAEHKFIAGADLAGNTGLELNDVGIIDKTETTQHTLPALKFVKLNNRQCISNLLLDRLDLVGQSHFVRILAVQLWQSW